MAQLQNTPNTSDNQMEALKNYGSYIVSAIVLALAGYFGWTYWQTHHARVDTVAADRFADIQQLSNELTLASQNPDLEADAKTALSANQSKLNKDIDGLVASHSKTVYAWQALMIKARQQADSNDYKAANETLKQALSIDLKDAGLTAITELRYAQTLLASGDPAAALGILQKEMPDAFDASKQELLGDVYLAQNKKEDAIKAYSNAWEILRKRQESRAVLALKMDSLGINVEPIEPPASLVTAPVTEAPALPTDNASVQASGVNNEDTTSKVAASETAATTTQPNLSVPQPATAPASK